MRGAMFLPKLVAGASTWLYLPAAMICNAVAAMFSAVGRSRYGALAFNTLVTPETDAAAVAAPLLRMTGDQHVDVAADLARRGDRMQRRRLQRGVVVLGDDQD